MFVIPFHNDRIIVLEAWLDDFPCVFVYVQISCYGAWNTFRSTDMKEEFLRYEYGHVREAETYKYFYVRFLCKNNQD